LLRWDFPAAAKDRRRLESPVQFKKEFAFLNYSGTVLSHRLLRWDFPAAAKDRRRLESPVQFKKAFAFLNYSGTGLPLGRKSATFNILNTSLFHHSNRAGTYAKNARNPL
jgi:hypothetical protein